MQDARVARLARDPRLRPLLQAVADEGDAATRALLAGTLPDERLFQAFAMDGLRALGLRDADGRSLF